jgi:hypothetical protein
MDSRKINNDAEQVRRSIFLAGLNNDFRRLRDDKEAWAEYLEEIYDVQTPSINCSTDENESQLAGNI